MHRIIFSGMDAERVSGHAPVCCMVVASDVQTQLDAALGALASGNWREANEKLERLPPERRAVPEVVMVKCRAYAKAGSWRDVEAIASDATTTYPNEPVFYSQWAWALHRQGKTAEAHTIIDNAVGRFPRSVGIAYSAACLNGALKRRNEARQWLELAIGRASNPDKVKLRSLVQPELQCLWGESDAHLRRELE